MASIAVTSQNFSDEVLKSDKKVLVDFWAPWCGPCQMLSPIIDEIAQENESVKVVKVNVDEEPQLAGNYSVTAIPTVILFENGKISNTFVGFRQKQDFVAALQ